MQNLLIIDSNISYIQKIISNISQSIENIRLYNFYTNTDEKIYDDLTHNNCDIVVVAVNQLDKNLINFLYQRNLEYYEKSIIILYDDINQLQDLLVKKYSPYIFRCIKKSNNTNSLVKNLSVLTYAKENNYNETILEIKIKNALNKIGFCSKHIGTMYLIEAIKYIYINKIDQFKLNDIYSYLSIKYQKSSNTVKGVIRRATEYMYKHYDENFIIKYFNYLELEKLPAVSEVISTIVEKI